MDCAGLTEVNIPNSVTSIGSYAFYQCTGLTEVIIGEGVTEIGYRAFSGCTGLTQVTIGNSVTSIGSSAFQNCTGLTSVTIGNGVTEIGSSTFAYCSGLMEVTIGESVTSIGNDAFYQCAGLTEVNIPNSVTSIGGYAFRDCTGLTSITIPNNVKTIGAWAFCDCTSLTEVNFNAAACTSAGSSYSNRAFHSCNNITTFNFGDNVTIIPAYLCYGLTKLTQVTIPNRVTIIGDDAFYNCSKLVGITSLNQEPPSCGGGVFYDVDTKTCILYVPEGSLGAYANASTWKDFYNIVEIEVDAIADILEKGDADVIGYYTLDGKMIVAPQRGINIIRYSDGSTSKVLIK